MPTVETHPLGEILSRKLFGFTTVPPQEQKRMVNRAIKAAMKEYDILKAQRDEAWELLDVGGLRKGND